MNSHQAANLAKLLRRRRLALNLSVIEVARRARLADSNVARLEQSAIANPRPETLRRLADVLGLDLADLYAASGYVQPAGLPSFQPYLRAKYADLPPAARAELERSFARIARDHGLDPAGPLPGEDEIE